MSPVRCHRLGNSKAPGGCCPATWGASVVGSLRHLRSLFPSELTSLCCVFSRLLLASLPSPRAGAHPSGPSALLLPLGAGFPARFQGLSSATLWVRVGGHRRGRAAASAWLGDASWRSPRSGDTSVRLSCPSSRVPAPFLSLHRPRCCFCLPSALRTPLMSSSLLTASATPPNLQPQRQATPARFQSHVSSLSVYCHKHSNARD